MNEFLAAADLWWPGMVAMAALMLASGFFSACETALFYLSHDELRAFRTGRPRERVVALLLSDADRLLTALMFWNLIVNLTFFAVSVVIAQRLAAAHQQAAAGSFGAISVAGLILFGEVLPKSVAVAFRRPLAAWCSWPLALLVRALDPVTPALRRLSVRLRRTFWPHVTNEPILEARDLEQAVDASHLSEELVRQERQTLHNILDLSEIRAEEVMRPRGSYVVATAPVHLADLRGTVPPGDFLIVQRAGTEEIEGAVSLADFASLPERHLEQTAEEVIYVPWCANLAFTLQALRDRFAGVACVINEYGDPIGVVTYEDVVETVLHPDPSRARRVLRREPVIEVAPGRYEVEGLTTLRFLANRLEIDYEPESDSLTTVTGLLSERLERVPTVGDECEWQGFRVEVIEVLDRRGLRALVERVAPGDAEAETAAESER